MLIMAKMSLRIGLLILSMVLVILLLAGCGSNSGPAANPTQPPATSPAPSSAAPATTTNSVPASTPAPAPPASSAIFRIGYMGQMSGDAGAAVTKLFQESEYMMKYINEVEGGINGVKLDWKMADNRGTADGAIVAYKQLRDTYKPNLYVQVEDFLLLGMLKDIATDGSVITTTSAIVPNLYNPPARIYSHSMPTVDGFGAYLNWVISDWKGPGNPRVGVLYWSDNQSAQAWMGAKAWGERKNIEFVPVTYSITALDLKAQLLKFKDSKVNYIWAHAITPNAAVVVRDANSLGIAKQISITFMEYVESQELLKQAGDAVEGFYGYIHHSPYSEGTQAAKIYTQMWKQFGNKDNVWSDNRGVITLKGLLNALVPKIAADIKDNKLTNDALNNALSGLSNIDTWGNNKDFGYGPTKRVGISALKIHQYTKTGTITVGDWVPMPRFFEGVEK